MLFNCKKLDFRKSRGKVVKSVNEDNNLAKGSIKLDETCSTCTVVVNTKGNLNQTVECASCSTVYHNDCLINSLHSEFFQLQASDPSVWWFCRQCVSKSYIKSTVAATNTEEQDEMVDTGKGNDQVDFISIFSSFKTDLKKELSAIYK